MKRSPIERFLAHTKPIMDGCWRWSGPPAGLMIKGKQVSPQQLAWFVEHRAIPTFPLVTTCGMGHCVRPSHLVRLMKPKPVIRRKGRRLSDEAVQAIRYWRDRGMPLAKLAKQWGISVSGVSRICSNDRRVTAA